MDQIEGMSVADAERAVDGLAAWHATWWRQAEVLAESGLTVSLGDEIYKAVLPLVFGEGWEKLNAELDLPAAILAVGPRWSAAMPRLLDGLAEEPTTMTHGDFRADNLFFEADGSVAAVDFQLIGTGRGAYDLAYFVTQSITASRRVACTSGRSSTGGSAALVAAGVPEADLETAWDDYRAAALFCLVYPVVAWRGMDVGRSPPAGPRHDDARALRSGGGRARPRGPPLTPGGSDGPWPTLADRNPQGTP